MRLPFSRSICFAFASLVIAPALVEATEVKIVRVWPNYRDSESFVRVVEYFGGKEKAPELIMRSRQESRDGYYFLTRLKTSEALPGSILAIEYVLPGDEEPQVQFFPLDLPKGSRAVLAGVTGADWPKASVAPTAWRVRLLGPSGAELVREQSFLWSMPPSAVAEIPPGASPAATAN